MTDKPTLMWKTEVDVEHWMLEWVGLHTVIL